MDKLESIALIQKTAKVLAAAATFEEIRDVRNRAQAVRAYAKKSRSSIEAVIEAAELRLRAERKLGHALQLLPLAKAAPGNQYGRRTSTGTACVYLRDLGITESDSSRAQRIASLPVDKFEQYIAASYKSRKEPSIAGMLRVVRDHSAGHRRCRPAAMNANCWSTIQLLVSERRRFGTIVVRPAWPSCDSHSSAVLQRVLQQLKLEPVASLALSESHLFVQTKSYFLPESLELISAWGFDYASCLAQTQECGPVRGAEFLLIGRRGVLPVHDSSCNVDQGPLLIAETLSDGPYLALQIPAERAGWTVCP